MSTGAPSSFTTHGVRGRSPTRPRFGCSGLPNKRAHQLLHWRGGQHRHRALVQRPCGRRRRHRPCRPQTRLRPPSPGRPQPKHGCPTNRPAFACYVTNARLATSSARYRHATAAIYVIQRPLNTFSRAQILRRRYQHHCRNCGRVVCSNCSQRQWLLPHIAPTPSRVCNVCYDELLNESVLRPVRDRHA